MIDGLMVLVLVVMGVLVLGRGSRIRAAGVALLATVVATASVYRASSARMELFGPTLLRVPTEQPWVALTFDDGPTEAYTDPVLEMLAADDAKATFFVTGRELSEHPELGQRIVDAGHELGNHSWSHPRLIFRSAAVLRQQIDDTDVQIRRTGQRGEIPFRPPYGKRLLGLHWALGDRPAVLWDLEPESDPALATDPEALAAHVVEGAEPGSIVLLHAMYRSREVTRQALPAILSGLREKGLGVTTLRDLRTRVE